VGRTALRDQPEPPGDQELWQEQARPSMNDPQKQIGTIADARSRAGAPGSPEQPVLLGRYRVVEMLGQGGFGRVYRAYDHELDRAVAIKVPHRERISRP